MSTKTVPFRQPVMPKTADNWVETRAAEQLPTPAPVVPTRRLTVDLPKDLHKRFKNKCTNAEVDMSVAVRQLIEDSLKIVEAE